VVGCPTRTSTRCPSPRARISRPPSPGHRPSRYRPRRPRRSPRDWRLLLPLAHSMCHCMHDSQFVATEIPTAISSLYFFISSASPNAARSISTNTGAPVDLSRIIAGQTVEVVNQMRVLEVCKVPSQLVGDSPCLDEIPLERDQQLVERALASGHTTLCVASSMANNRDNDCCSDSGNTDERANDCPSHGTSAVDRSHHQPRRCSGTHRARHVCRGSCSVGGEESLRTGKSRSPFGAGESR
jgi:hypothetical protein